MEEQVQLALESYVIYEDYAKSQKDAVNLIVRINSGGDLKFLLTGSYAEGFPDAVDSDIDMMFSTTECLTSKWQKRLFEFLPNAPAHLKVIIPNDLVVSFNEEYPIMTKIQTIIRKNPNENVSYVSAKAFRDLNVKDFLPDNWKFEKPSASIDSNTSSLTSPSYCLKSNICERVTCDRVPAIECENWPSNAGEWVSRPSRFWPSQTVVRKIAKNGFSIVPKPSSSSGDIEKEWRLSFSSAEAVLLQGLTGNPRKVYYVLRSIYVRYIKRRGETILSSYNIKTVLFWMMQDKEPVFWEQEQLSVMILSVLQRLYDCLMNRNCPHFFIPEHNLLYAASDQEYKQALAVLKEVLWNPERILIMISNAGFLGLLPRFGLLTVETFSRQTKEVLKMTEMKAAALLNPKSQDDITHSQKLEDRCLILVLRDLTNALKSFPDGSVFLDINVPLVFKGYHLARAIKGNGLKLECDVPAIFQSDEDFFTIGVREMNLYFLLWCEIFTLAVACGLAGKDVLLFRSLHEIKQIVTNQEENTWNDSDLDKLKTFNQICSIPAGFMASAEGNVNAVRSEQVYEALEETLKSCDKLHLLCDQTFPEPMMYVLIGGTYQVAVKMMKDKI